MPRDYYQNDVDIFCGAEEFTRHIFGYETALQILLETAEKTDNRHYIRHLIYPILLLSGHLIEIHLKAIILHWNQFCGSQVERDKYKTLKFDDTHNLCELFDMAEKCFLKYCDIHPGFHYSGYNQGDEFKGKKNLLIEKIKWLNGYYKDSMAPRYPFDKKGNIYFGFSKSDTKEEILKKDEGYHIIYSELDDNVHYIKMGLDFRLDVMHQIAYENQIQAEHT